MYCNRIVLEWTELNGRRIPKKVIVIVPKGKVPKVNKGNGELVDKIFKNEYNSKKPL